MFVANKIKQLIDNKFQVYDAKAKEKRDIKYKDIVVLLRSTKISAPIFEKEIIKLEFVERIWMKNAVIYVHGKGGNAEEANRYK